MQSGTLAEPSTRGYEAPEASEVPYRPADYEAYGEAEASAEEEATTDGRGWHLLGVALIGLVGLWLLLTSLDGGSMTALVFGLLLLGFTAWSLLATRLWTDYQDLSSGAWTILSLPGRTLVFIASLGGRLGRSDHDGVSRAEGVWWVLILLALFGDCSSS